jgi:uncharacterized membrane protein YedE/YeeE
MLQIKSRFNFGKACYHCEEGQGSQRAVVPVMMMMMMMMMMMISCYHPVQRLSSFCLLSRNVKIRLGKNTIAPMVLNV